VSGVVVEIGAAVRTVRCGDAVVALMGEAFGDRRVWVSCQRAGIEQAREIVVEKRVRCCGGDHDDASVSQGAVTARREDFDSDGDGRDGINCGAVGEALWGGDYATAGSQGKLEYLESLG